MLSASVVVLVALLSRLLEVESCKQRNIFISLVGQVLEFCWVLPLDVGVCFVLFY